MPRVPLTSASLRPAVRTHSIGENSWGLRLRPSNSPMPAPTGDMANVGVSPMATAGAAYEDRIEANSVLPETRHSMYHGRLVAYASNAGPQAKSQQQQHIPPARSADGRHGPSSALVKTSARQCHCLSGHSPDRGIVVRCHGYARRRCRATRQPKCSCEEASGGHER